MGRVNVQVRLSLKPDREFSRQETVSLARFAILNDAISPNFSHLRVLLHKPLSRGRDVTLAAI